MPLRVLLQFFFLKPHANTEAAAALVRAELSQAGVSIAEEVHLKRLSPTCSSFKRCGKIRRRFLRRGFWKVCSKVGKQETRWAQFPRCTPRAAAVAALAACHPASQQLTKIRGVNPIGSDHGRRDRRPDRQALRHFG